MQLKVHTAKHQIKVSPPCPAVLQGAVGSGSRMLQVLGGAGSCSPPAPTTEVGHVSERPPYCENLLKSLPRLTKEPAPLWFALTRSVCMFGGLWLPWHRISSTNETSRG